MLYPDTQNAALSDELFRSPTSEYRGTPFWAWNCDMTPEMLCRQIEMFKEMGLGGFHMHSRSGMAVPYLSDRFMALVKACVEKARQEKMLAWLYDEDRWPSGAAGGLVTKDHQYRARTLVFSPEQGACGTLLGRYAIALDDEGFLTSYRVLQDKAKAGKGEREWRAFLEIAEDAPWYNNQAYIDTLSPKAVKRFIEVTHDRYAECVGEDFGGVIPAIFTDEPQVSRKKTLGFAKSLEKARLPWSDDFPATFGKAYGEDIMARLPELFWDLPQGAASTVRYHYHAHASQRFAEAFAVQVGAWCQRHNIALTGHMMEEPTLRSQSEALGEAMQSLASFQLPGIDMLCNRYEYTTAKQAQSVAHQYGREGVLSELYGVTGWHFDFRGHKLQGDWQAALGITVRVQHLSWVSMAGPAKRDYPASISYQSPWYKEYAYIEDHFARVNTAMVRGKPLVRVGLVHPVESYWLHYGPAEQSYAVREEMDQQFLSITDWLLNGLIDFNYISESLLPSQCKKGKAPLKVGQMAYDTVLVPGCETLRATTVERLEAFAEAGGRLIFVGKIPSKVDAVPSDRVRLLADKAQKVAMERLAILDALEPLRDIEVKDEKGVRTNHLLYQMRADGKNRWLFLCNGRPVVNQDIVSCRMYTLVLKGNWKPTYYDTQTGDIRPYPCAYQGGKTLLLIPYYPHDSLLFQLAPGKAEPLPLPTLPAAAGAAKCYRGEIEVALSEPNVLLLDQAEYAFDDGEWQPKAEILEIDSRFRKLLGYASREGRLAQPWVTPEVASFDHFLRLRFDLHAKLPISAPKLALENPELCQVWLNGEQVSLQAEGWFVDEAIKTVGLPEIPAGDSVLELRMPIGQRLGAEWCYLLGDFGVSLHGDKAIMTEPVRKLGFGDWTRQGLPFYAGNVTYRLPVTTQGRFVLEVPQYRNPLLTVALDGQRLGRIVYAPYQLPVITTPGEHVLELTAYGNRANAFGSVHNADRQERWLGPNAWRSTDNAWCDEYNLWEIGVSISPRIYECEG